MPTKREPSNEATDSFIGKTHRGRDSSAPPRSRMQLSQQADSAVRTTRFVSSVSRHFLVLSVAILVVFSNAGHCEAFSQSQTRFISSRAPLSIPRIKQRPRITRSTKYFATVDDSILKKSIIPSNQENNNVVPESESSSCHVHDHMTRTDQVVMILSMAAAVLAFAGLLSVSGPGGWRYYVAGGACAATSHAITTPIDVVKTRKQVDPSLEHTSFPEATVKIVQNEGWHALLVGLGPTTVGYLMEGAIKFGIYEVLKPVVAKFLSTVARISTLAFIDSQVIGFILCGSASGVAASVMLCPMEALRIRLVAEPEFAPTGWLEGGYKMLKNEGVSALWKGLTPMLYKQVPYTVTKNVSFDFMTKIAYATLRSGGHAMTAATKVAVPLVSAVVASILSCISSQPGDMLLSLVNAHEGDKRTAYFVKDILKSEHGVRGFFVGTKTRFLHVGIIVTVQLLIYDFIKRLCGVAATGIIS